MDATCGRGASLFGLGVTRGEVAFDAVGKQRRLVPPKGAWRERFKGRTFASDEESRPHRPGVPRGSGLLAPACPPHAATPRRRRRGRDARWARRWRRRERDGRRPERRRWDE